MSRRVNRSKFRKFRFYKFLSRNKWIILLYMFKGVYLCLESVKMAKRVAGRDLNHHNWDQEEEAETAGHFKKVLCLMSVQNLVNAPW